MTAARAAGVALVERLEQMGERLPGSMPMPVSLTSNRRRAVSG
jgi:hypothetical protein